MHPCCSVTNNRLGMKRIIFFWTLLTVVVSLRAQHRLDSLYIWVVLQPNGDAYIEEDRYMWLDDEGTEVYEKMYNLNDRQMGIKNFGVRDSIYGEYERVDWNVHGSRSWKEGRCGINHVDQGLELCWGFGTPGEHVFTTYYLLQNLVQSYTDYDGFNHCFYDASNPPAEKVVTTIMAADSTLYLSKENTGIWHFKYYGEAWFLKSGKTLFESTQPLDEGDKVVVMMQFQKGMFSPLISHEETFVERVKERAFIGSDYEIDDPGDGGGTKSSFFGGNDASLFETIMGYIIGGICCIVLPLGWLLSLIFKKPLERKRRRKLILKVLGNPDEIPYHRDVPLGGKLIQSQKILRDTLGILSQKPTFGVKELTEALLLRLLYKGNISVDTELDEKGELHELFRIKPVSQDTEQAFRAEDEERERIVQRLLSKNKNSAATKKEAVGQLSEFLKKKSNAEDEEMEYGLQRLLYAAAGDDHLLQPDELKTFIRNEQNTLQFRGFAQKLTSVTQVYSDYSVESRFKQVSSADAREVFGFWQYLNDFSLIGEREVVEVHLWKDYLVFGALYGIAKKVREGMKKICPDYGALDQLTRNFLQDNTKMFTYVSLLSAATYDTVRYSSTYETMAERRAREAEEARERARERYSGGGGHSSFGGGGGFSGGGGSGVR